MNHKKAMDKRAIRNNAKLGCQLPANETINILDEIEQYRNLHVAALAAYRELDGQGYASIYELEDALGHLPLPTKDSGLPPLCPDCGRGHDVGNPCGDPMWRLAAAKRDE